MNAPSPPELAGPPPVRHALAFEQGAMSYLAQGERGPLVVFCHATGFNAQTYRLLYEALGPDVRVIAPDQRGHGFTTLPADPNELKNWLVYAEDLVAFLERAIAPKDRPVVLSGHSMGGTVSLLAASLRPDLARALVLVDPVFIPKSYRWLMGLMRRGRGGRGDFLEGARRRRAVWPSRAAMVEAYRTRATFSTWPVAMVRDYVEGGTRERDDGQVELTCAPAWEAATFGMQNHNLWAAIATTRCPVTILRGARQSTCPLPVALRLQLLPPHAEVRTLPGTSHFVPMERVPVVAGVLRAVLTGSSAV